VELFLDYWIMGRRNPELQSLMRASVARQRELMTELAVPLLAGAAGTGSRVTAQGLAAAAVSFAQGCALQAMIDPGGFDVAEALETVDVMLGSVTAPAEDTD
jgi:hypothetical protein